MQEAVLLVLATNIDCLERAGKVCLHLRYKDTNIYTRIDLQTSRPMHRRTPQPPRYESRAPPPNWFKEANKNTLSLFILLFSIITVAFVPTVSPHPFEEIQPQHETHSGAPTCHFCLFSFSFLTWCRFHLTKPEQEDTKTKLAQKENSRESEPEGITNDL